MIVPGSASALLLKSAAPTGYNVERSIRLNASDSAYLSRTPSSSGNRRTWTWAGWVKKGSLADGNIFSAGTSDTNRSIIGFGLGNNDSKLYVLNNVSGSGYNSHVSAAVFRDVSAWYHFVIAADTAQAAAADRFKFYVNGVLQTWETTANPQNTDTLFNTTSGHAVGSNPPYAASGFFSGYLADIHFIDGQALDPTSFTEVSATTGQLVPIEYTGSYGPLVDQSEVWSNALSGSLKTPTAGFDANPYSGRSEGVGGLTFTPTTPLVFTDKVEVYDNNNVTKSRVNSGSYVQHASNAWVTVASGGGTIATMYFLRTDNASYDAGFYAIRVDGKLLVDQGVTVPSNGFHLPFSDNSTTAALGTDTSGNSNTWTVNNISVAAGAGNDSLVDTPTSYGTDTGAGGEVRGNYCTWNALAKGSDCTLSNGNLDVAWGTAGSTTQGSATIGMSSGKWYWETTITASSASPTNAVLGITTKPFGDSEYPGYSATSWGYRGSDGQKWTNTSGSSYGASYANGDVIGIAFDADAGTLTFYKNGSSQGTAFTGLTSGPYFPAIGDQSSSQTFSAASNFGQRPFAYTAPSGYKALCDTNLPAPVVAQPSTVMDVKLYTGNGGTQTISGLGFSPDLVWVKMRSTAGYSHKLVDTVRGATISLVTNNTNAELTEASGLTAFTSDGFSLGSQDPYNRNSDTFVAWTWDAGSSTVTNTQGSITSSVRANPSAGFSIVTYTGNGTNPSTVGHGLGVAPVFIIHKCRSTAVNWFVYHGSAGNGAFEGLNTTAAYSAASGAFGSTAPTSTVLTTGADTNTNGRTYVDYCFAPVAGYSSFGSYTGNGSTTDNTFVYTGMRPRFVMLKRSDSTGNWVIWDAVRNSYNVANSIILPNSSAAEYSPDAKIDILSNGFKVRDNSSDSGTNGATYIYMALAESPFQYARAR